MEYQIVMMVLMNLDAHPLVQTSAQTNSSNVRILEFAYHKDGIVMVPQIVKIILMNPPVVDLLNVQIITSNVTTKNVFTKVSYAMVRTIVGMLQMSHLLMVVVHPKLRLVHLANGLVQAWIPMFVLTSKRFVMTNSTVPMAPMKVQIVTMWNVTDMVVLMVVSRRLMEHSVPVLMAKF